MLKYGIPQESWDSIISTIRSCGKVTGITLFGSRAKGNFRNGSDIDLALAGNEISTKDIITISTCLDALDLPWQIDLLILDRITEESLTEHIKRCGIQLF
ncbi:MAG TPA: nucleotidyltransferase domain-containing protein [Candidatus Cloacimonadota bacterium]|nr:nucleotidyltransferase domain-containing protein [Candidatus Cloacimonadota bacterium]